MRNTRTAAIARLGDKMLSCSGARNKKEASTIFADIIKGINDNFEWKVVVEQVIKPNEESNLLKKPMDNGSHEDPESIESTSCGCKCLVKFAFNQIKEGSSAVKIALSFVGGCGKASGPILYLAKSNLPNRGIGVFADRNFHSGEPITAFIRVKTSQEDRYALQVATSDGAVDHMLSIPIKGNKKENRVGSALFVRGHF